MVEPLTLRHMVETITAKRAYSNKYKIQRYGSGDAYTNLLVVNFFGPAGARASAYCCNMNIDMDAEPQAYGPFGDPKITPIEKLSNGGWLDTATNAAKKKAYDDAVKIFDDLGKKKADLIAKSKPSGDPTKPAPAPPDPKAMADLDKEIEKAKQAMKDAAVFWDDDPAKRPVNFGKIFWKWYGPLPLSPAEARARSFDEKVGEEIVNGKSVPKIVHRKPVLDDKKPYLEDVNGRFPVIQSIYEPGTGYYVSAFPQRVNTAFPDWDQRSYLPPNSTAQVPYAALSLVLEDATNVPGRPNLPGLRLNDIVLGMRLDGGQSLTFPFLDHGYKPKVGECSMEAFTALGGQLAANVNASDNRFLVLFLAFPQSAGQSADSMLTKFAAAANADDFPVMLAFVAQATLDAKNDRTKSSPREVDGDPVTNFQRWKASQGTRSPGVLPSTFAVVDQALSNAGYSPFTQRLLKRHPNLLGGGPWLTRP